ncbi:MAG: O-antigen ligase family protein [Gemmatimonadaceae bacterium]|nr:O-antigen ligase family protein [Gemmatimonadaceae bacterium]
MTDLTSDVMRSAPRGGAAWPYALAAVALGAVAGSAVGSVASVSQLLLLIVGLFVAAIVLFRYQVGAVLIVLTLPLDEFGRVLSSPVSVTVFHLALVLTIASWGIALARGDARLRFSVVDLGIGALIFAALWSFPTSLAPSATAFATVRLVFLWLFTLFFANVLTSRRLLDWVTWTLVATAAGTALLASAQKYVPGFNFGSVRLVSDRGTLSTRVGAFFHDPNYLAGFLSVALIVTIALLVHSKTWGRVGVCVGAAAIISLGVAVTLSRTGLVGVAAGVVVIVATAPRRRMAPLALGIGVIMLLLALAAPSQLINRVRSIGEVSGDQSNATRVYMYPSAYEIARDNLAFGTGLGAFRYAYPAYRRVEADSTVVKPHEIPLSLVSETGVAGIITQLVLIWGLTVTFWRRRPNGWTTAESFALAGIVSLGVQSLFQYYLYFEYVWLFIAFAVAANRIARQEEAL